MCLCVSFLGRDAVLRACRPWICCVLCASERVLWRAALPCEREGRGVVAFRVHQRELLGAQRLLAGVKVVELLHWACICVTVVSWHMTFACVRAGCGVDRIRRFCVGVKAVESCCIWRAVARIPWRAAPSCKRLELHLRTLKVSVACICVRFLACGALLRVPKGDLEPHEPQMCGDFYYV